MRASNVEKRAVRDLCVAKRTLSLLEKDTTSKRQRWVDQSKQAKRALEAALPDGTCYKVGEQYLRRDVYNRMSPIVGTAVRAAIREISSEDVRACPEYSSSDPWPAFLKLLKRRLNDQRNTRGDYVRLTKAKPRDAAVTTAPQRVLEIAALHERAKERMKHISNASNSQRVALKQQMAGLEPMVMEFMKRTRKERQRVSIHDTLSGGGTVQHGFSIHCKQRTGKPKITMDKVFESVRSVAGDMSLREFDRDRRRLSTRIVQILGDLCQPDQQFYLSLRSSGIRE